MFRCNTCENKTYSSKAALNKHDRQVHNIFKELLYECQLDDCPETFPSKRKLQEHGSKAHTNKNFQCDECGNLYSSEKYLKVHNKNHPNQSSVDKKKEICVHVKVHNKHKRLLCPVKECREFYNR